MSNDIHVTAGKMMVADALAPWTPGCALAPAHEHTTACGVLSPDAHERYTRLWERLEALHGLRDTLRAEIARLDVLSKQLNENVALYIKAIDALMSQYHAQARFAQAEQE